MALAARDDKLWQEQVQMNRDGGYGQAVIEFAETWARLMEARIAGGEALADCAEPTSYLAAHHFGLTGFQYGCAVSILAAVWRHGEELRRWHNLKIQVRDEGERANESGGVLNPALLTLEV